MEPSSTVESSPQHHIRHLMLFCFQKGFSAAVTKKRIHDLYGQGSTTLRTVERWFSRFKKNNFSLKNGHRTGRPVVFDENALENLLRNDHKQTTRDLAEQLHCSHSTIENHLHSMGYTAQFGAWIQIPDETPSTSVIEPINATTIREVGKTLIGNQLLFRSKSIKKEPAEFNNETNSVMSDSPYSATPNEFELVGSSRNSFGNAFDYSFNQNSSELVTLRKRVQKQEMDIEQLEKALTKAQSQARMVAPVVPNEVEVLRRSLLQRENRIQEVEEEMTQMKTQRGKLHSIIGQHQEDLATANEKIQKLQRELESVMRRFN